MKAAGPTSIVARYFFFRPQVGEETAIPSATNDVRRQSFSAGSRFATRSMARAARALASTGLAAVRGAGSPAAARALDVWSPLGVGVRLDQVESYDLERFVAAQNAGGIYEAAMAELRSGRKRGHWMWFVFPQIAGLGRSSMAQTYAISSLAEARAYMSHPILGPRLVEAARILIALQRSRPEEIFGDIDATKLRSSMTLFARADPREPVFPEVLDAYFGGETDAATDNLIATLDR